MAEMRKNIGSIGLFQNGLDRKHSQKNAGIDPHSDGDRDPEPG